MEKDFGFDNFKVLQLSHGYVPKRSPQYSFETPINSDLKFAKLGVPYPFDLELYEGEKIYYHLKKEVLQ